MSYQRKLLLCVSRFALKGSRHVLRTSQLKRAIPRRDWTREELIVAFNLYCKIPFGRIHIRNPLVIEMAKAVRRTPSAVSWKLANFARLDPALQKRNIAGAAHGAKAEVEVWNEFSNDWDKLAFESERLLDQLTGRPSELVEESRGFPREGAARRLFACASIKNFSALRSWLPMMLGVVLRDCRSQSCSQQATLCRGRWT